ncbi:MAG: phosphoribosylformylglycinamidine synthase subunit PurL [Candidatus Omnitrophota bacterium]|jgi:phosphoribosylformylglycinamidine synthase|nr:MAG: phosphoribosylformylglycinamidine synthase subunit PurL [Candidatus Omnitrophota bacterium]
MNETIATELYSNPKALAIELKRYGLSLTPQEAIQIKERLGRAPSLAELFIFDIEWSEHCSYKSSKHLLKKYLPVSGRNVIQGPEEDAGILFFTTIDDHRYGIVIAHESHNHPSQVLPFEGAATGIGGIVRDVDCMGASVIGVADPLRFGNPNGNHAERTKSIVEGVVEGIWHYGNALGVPNLGGDVVFHDGFDDNCLVNVVAIGLLREDEIIHSRVPEEGDGYDLILIGKPTDRSGFGGASFASGTLNSENEEENKGAVQIPDPFLKNILLHYKATHEVRRRARELGIKIGMKDLGAGGIACCSSEIGESGGFGVELNLDWVHVSEENLPPEVILCAETQERYLLAVPPSFTPEVLKIYNDDWELPSICSGAGAHVIGKAIQKPVMRVFHHGQLVTELPIDFVVEGIRYQRESEPGVGTFIEPVFAMPDNLNQLFLQMLAQPNIASKEWIFRHYDTEVQGHAVIRPGEADASLIVPIEGCPAGIALSVDGNPFYGEISPFWGGATAVAEAMRNIAAIGATPRAMTDCLNFGNPEAPRDFWALEEGIKGIAEAARKLGPVADREAIPFVSGNVSLYNQSATGRSIPPSPIIACVGVIEDASKAITMEIKASGHLLLLIGERFNELGGSEYYRVLGKGPGANAPIVRYAIEQGIIYGTIQAIDKGLVLSAHDISNGGLLTSAAEMLLATHPRSDLGLKIHPIPPDSALREDITLFSESSGMLLEASPDHADELIELYKTYALDARVLGITTTEGRLLVYDKNDESLIDLSVEEMRQQWRGAFGLTLAT